MNSLRWQQDTTTVAKHYGRISERPCFPGENSQEISTNNGDSKSLRRSLFNTAWSFGIARVREVREILGVWEGFLGICEKTKEKKDMAQDLQAGFFSKLLRRFCRGDCSAGPKCGCLNMGA